MSSSRTAIIILNWNGLKDTTECLQSIQNSYTQNISTYVVDNRSQNDELKTLHAKFPWILPIQNQKNLGFSGGNNIGIKSALANNTDNIILLNNDTVVTSDTFTSLIKSAQTQSFHIASPKIYFYPGREYHTQSYKKGERGKIIWYAGGRLDINNIIAQHIGVDEFDHGQFDTPLHTHFATGCCMLVNKKVFAQIGYLDEGFLAYYEDNDFCQRAKKAGFRVGFAPQAYLWHKNAGSTGGSGSSQQNQIIKKSRLRFAFKHAPFKAKLALLRQSL